MSEPEGARDVANASEVTLLLAARGGAARAAADRIFAPLYDELRRVVKRD